MDKQTLLSKNTTPDRRAQRTRKTLSQALIALLQEKRYDSITVQDICDYANVGRSTFYAHYQDKEDLLTSNFQQVMAQLGSDMLLSDGELAFSIAPLFQHVKEHQHLYQALVWGGGLAVLLRAGQQQWSRQIEAHLALWIAGGHKPTVPPEVVAAYLAGVLQTLLIWWLNHKMPYSPERMDEMFQQLVMPGVSAAILGAA